MSETTEKPSISMILESVESAAGLGDPLAKEILAIANSAHIAQGPQLEFLVVLLTRVSVITLRECAMRGMVPTRQSLELMMPIELLEGL